LESGETSGNEYKMKKHGIIITHLSPLSETVHPHKFADDGRHVLVVGWIQVVIFEHLSYLDELFSEERNKGSVLVLQMSLF
jgi:ABC-type uncharacterized transport system substrate-binding protein